MEDKSTGDAIHEPVKNESQLFMKKSLDINQSSNELGVSEDEIQEINFEIKDPKESGAKEENPIDDNIVNSLENKH
jgi:hypothetical protein